MTNGELESASRLRSCCYRLKYRMVLDGCFNLIMSILAGFLVNIFPMITIVLTYEKVSTLKHIDDLIFRSIPTSQGTGSINLFIRWSQFAYFLQQLQSQAS